MGQGNGNGDSQSVRQVLMLSVRSPHWERILSGEKSIELRRLRPRVCTGDSLVLYATAPVSAIVGSVTVQRITEHHPRHLWKLTSSGCGLTYQQFIEYFEGVERGFAIFVSSPRRSRQPLSLGQVQLSWPDFRAPQGYKYLDCDRHMDRQILGAVGIISRGDTPGAAARRASSF